MTFHLINFNTGGPICGAPTPHITTTVPSWVTCPDCLKVTKEKSE